MKTVEKKITVCYFGIHDQNFSRNKIFRQALENQGVKIIECIDRSRGVKKFFNLIKKYRAIKGGYDVMIVGYTSYIAVILARLITSKPIIFDALCTMYESKTFSHEASFLEKIKCKIIDFFAFNLSDVVLVESEPQRKYIFEKFGGKIDKYQVLYTSVDETNFYHLDGVKKEDKFIVLFRGRFTPEAGLKYVIEAAKILEKEDIEWRIIGFGYFKKEVERLIDYYNLKKVDLIFDELPFELLCYKMNECHISLGQFENNERLDRTIPHKAFESLLLKIPYITARAKGVESVFTDQENCIFVERCSSQDIADSVMKLYKNKDFREKIAEQGLLLFRKNFSNEIIGKKLFSIITQLAS